MPTLTNRATKIVPNLWYAKEAEDTARFYTSIFLNSRVGPLTPMQSDAALDDRIADPDQQMRNVPEAPR